MRAAALLLLFLSSPALAHAGETHGGWTLAPWIVVPLLASASLYGWGWLRLRRRSEYGRTALGRAALLFAAGWATLAAALVSPLHEAGEASFTMHMIEHELIMLPAALLLVAARPGAVFLWGLPAAARNRIGRAVHAAKPVWRGLTDPVAATLLQLAVMAGWHAPALFGRALERDSWHVAQHLSFLLSALLFWWAMTHGRGGRHGHGTASLCLFLTSLGGGALGALMTFSGSPWYEGYAAMGMTPQGLTPIEDQQLAGLLMWIPGGIFHAAAALYFLWQWLKSSEVSHAFAE
ncbi:cytochrome c oxidase assembly protein [Sphingomonas parva]|uniref:Cytochrome c oxidase assembly protein n=1 Tax=Sphingomonas parva TaxID=2555898 RepID=A0A4Y8ZUQ8_9SPHN|nr:cytochrome c oxidase assembly protein [Sphingomonas parva]TFI58875.1 cytochrome c oxidase assembly protein [Sphingomonas parva]